MTRPMLRLAPIIAGLLLTLVLAPTAAAATRDKIIKDCADDGQLQGDYSRSDLRDARQNLPSDVAEYTDCADVLRRAELPEGGSGAGGDSGDGAAAASGGGDGPLLTPQTDADHSALRAAAADGDQPVRINGQNVVPGASGLKTGAPRNGIPATLLAAIILLGLGGAALSVPWVRERLPFPGRRS